MKAKLLGRVPFRLWAPISLLVLISAPMPALSQARDSAAAALDREIEQRIDFLNRQLENHPAPPPLAGYRIALQPGGQLLIDTRLGAMTLRRHSAYIEDIGSVHINLESREPPYTTILFVCKTGECFLVTDEKGSVSARDRGGFDFGFDRRLARQMETAAKELIQLALADPRYSPPRR